jgi:tetratricopeptide (TPR) repeat protein
MDMMRERQGERHRSGLSRLGIALATVIALAGGPARADAIGDCNDGPDPDTRIRGCDIVIAEGAAPDVMAIAHMNRAIGFAARGALDRALVDLDAAVALDPDQVAVLYNRGNVRLELGRTEAAIEDFSAVIRQMSQFAFAWLNRGLAREHGGDKAGAAGDYAMALALDPKLAAARRALARVRPRS